MSAKVLFRSALLFASLVALGVALKMSGLAGALDETWIDAHIRGQGVAGQLIFVGVCGLFAAVGLPRQIVSFLGGYAFGFVEGTALALAATVLGCVTAFFYARLVGRALVQHRFPAKIRNVDAFLRDNPFTMTLLIRFLPLGSNLITNLAAGVSIAPWAAFVAGSAVGYIPQTMVFALVGSGIGIEPGLRLSLSAVLFAASAVLGVHLYRRYRHGRTFDAEIERALDNGVQDRAADSAANPATGRRPGNG